MDYLKNYTHRILRKSEKYFKTDMVYLAKGGSWLVIGQIIYALSSFFLALAFANLLPQDIYGTYKYIIAFAGILIIPSLAGMNTAVTQSVARGNEGVFFPALNRKMSWGMLGGLGSLILAIYYFASGNVTLALGFLIIAPFLPFYDSLGLYLSVLQGRAKFNLSTMYAALSQIISVCVLIGTIFLTHNLFILLVAYFTPWVITRALFQKIALSKDPLNTEISPDTILAGMHLSFMNVIPLVAQQLDKILLFHYVGPVQLAIYSFALAIPDQIKSMVKNLQIIILPKFASKTSREIHLSITSKFILFVIILSFIVALYWGVAPFIYKLFFPQYIESAFYSQIYSISLIASVLVLPYSMLQAKLATKELYQFNISRSIMQIGLLCVGAYYWGILGVIIARVLTDFFNLGILMFLVKKISKNS